MLLISLILAATITTKADVPRLSVTELRALMDRGEAVPVDVRGTVPYELGHLPGAIWAPLGRLDQQAHELPQDKTLVAYCTCKAEELSLEAALQLAQKYGFEKVAVLKGGYPAWKDAGLPVNAIQQAEVHFAPSEPQPAEASRGGSGGRLAPPSAVKCDRNQLTSYAGKAKTYRRAKGKTTIVIDTSANTVETVTLRHAGSDDASRSYLIEGKPFTKADWKRIESKKGVLRKDVSLVAWVCTNGATVVDWRPGVTFSGAE
jgi:rhodanese-related sulfurtransferase